MNTITIPPKSYYRKISKILNLEVLPNLKNREFNNVRRLIYSNEKIITAMKEFGITVDEISSGVSDRKAFKGYINQIVRDFKDDRYYRNYYPSAGNIEARTALSVFENYKFDQKKVFVPDDFCLSEGSTGAITMIFEYLKKRFPKSEILIQAPNYYLYKFAANYYGMKIMEITPLKTKDKFSFIGTDAIIDNISPSTKMIILTNPANPSGEIYPRSSLSRILKIAKEKNILVLADELFGELVFEPKNYYPSDKIASDIKALNNLVIIKGYSKSKNLVGLRIGYLYSKNKDLISEISLISQQRSSYSVASNFTGLIALDCFIQSVRQNPKLKFDQILKDFNTIAAICGKPKVELKRIITDYMKYFDSLMNFYSDNYDAVIDELGKEIEVKFPKTSAFNTIVKIRGLDNMNSFDFMLNLFLTTGVKTEIGPCFGFFQKTWDEKMGFWLRVTFAKNQRKLRKGLKKFLLFKKIYISDPDKFLKTDLMF